MRFRETRFVLSLRHDVVGDLSSSTGLSLFIKRERESEGIYWTTLRLGSRTTTLLSLRHPGLHSKIDPSFYTWVSQDT